ncbi:MAG: DNA-binding protein [Burkholderiaceae bacterium]
MGREATITQQDVNTICDALAAEGIKVTNRAVRERLDTGSMGTIVKLVNNWKSGQAKNISTLNQEIDSEIARGINSMISRKINDATTELNSRIEELEHDLRTVIQENERQVEDLKNITSEADELRANSFQMQGRIDQMIAEADMLRNTNKEEIRARELIQNSLMHVELQVTQIQVLQHELKIAREEAVAFREEAAELRGQLIGREQKWQHS